MSYTLKTHQISVKDPTTGQYSGVDILAEQTEQGLIAELQAEGTAQVNRIGQAAVDVQAAVDKAESDAAGIISETQQSINTLEREKNTIAATVASMAELGTDATLSTPGMAADAAAVGELNRQLNDETTGLDTKAPAILETASGAIASFDDGADSMPIRKLVATIEPVQEGTGDPSPDNVRPISGWTGANIHGTAVNIFGGALLRDGIKAAISSATIDDQTKTIVFTSGASTVKPFTSEAGLTNRFKANTQYTFLLTYVKTKGNNITSNMRIYYTDGSYENITPLASATTKQTTVTVSAAGKTVLALTKTNSAGWTAVYYEESGIFEGILTADDFAPYTGTTLPINWQSEAGTVYGGTVTLNEDGSADVNAEFVEVIVDGLNIKATVYVGTGSIPFVKVDTKLELFPYTDKTVKPDILSSYCITVDQTQRWGDFNAIIGKTIDEADNIIVVGLKNAGNGVSSFNSFFATNNLQVVARLKTPIVYHFSDIGQLYTYLGTNNVWIDTGSISECDYPADTKLFLTARDEEITGNIAPIENGTTASKAYAQGAYFWHDTKFCKALTAIASGATFTLDTNYQETTVAAELLAAQN